MLSTENNCGQLFIRAAQTHPNRIALTDGRENITFSLLQKWIEASASRFQEKGIEKNDAVLVFIPVSISLYVHVMALLYVGAVPVLVDEWADIKRIRQCCETVTPKALLLPWKYRWIVFLFKFLRRIPLRISPSNPHISTQNKSITAVNLHDPALITFTTGSTGIPKAAIRTHAILKAQLNALSPFLINDASVCLTLLPIVVLLNLGLGKTTVISRTSPKNYTPADAKELVLLIEKEQIDTIIASPFLLTELAKCVIANGQTMRYVKKIVTGGGPVFPTDAALMCQAFPQITTTVVYGSTEAEPISHLNAAVLANWPDTIEKGLPAGAVDAAATVAIIPMQEEAWPPMSDVQWQQQLTWPETVGEIVVSGDHVVKHYLKNKTAESATKINVGQTIWHRTGDAGRLDAQGQLFLYGRCSQVMYYDNRTLYPFLIEYEAKQVSGIRQAAFLNFNGKPVLAFSTTAEYDEKAFTSWARNRWGKNLLTERLPSIPLDARHRTKVDYAALKKMIRS